MVRKVFSQAAHVFDNVMPSSPGKSSPSNSGGIQGESSSFLLSRWSKPARARRSDHHAAGGGSLSMVERMLS